MSKNPSEKDRKHVETDAHKDGNQEQQERRGKDVHDKNREGEAMRRHNAKQKFVSDEDIKKRPA